MTIRIQRTSADQGTIFRLSGELVSSNRQDFLEEIEASTNLIALDLAEITLVDLEIVQLLALSETNGIELLNCPSYIREWISIERGRAIERDHR